MLFSLTHLNESVKEFIFVKLRSDIVHFKLYVTLFRKVKLRAKNNILNHLNVPVYQID